LALKFSGVFRYTSRECPREYRLPEATARPQPRPFSYKKAVCECLLSLVTQTSLLAAFSDTLFIRRCDWCGQYHLGITSTSIWILNLVSVVCEDPCDGLDRCVLSTFQCLGSLSCPGLALIQLVYDDSRCVTLILCCIHTPLCIFCTLVPIRSTAVATPSGKGCLNSICRNRDSSSRAVATFIYGQAARGTSSGVRPLDCGCNT